MFGLAWFVLHQESAKRNFGSVYSNMLCREKQIIWSLKKINCDTYASKKYFIILQIGNIWENST